MPRGTLLKRLERAEESAKALTPLQLSSFDEDALAIYSAMSYLDATMEPSSLPFCLAHQDGGKFCRKCENTKLALGGHPNPGSQRESYQNIKSWLCN